MSSPKRAAKDRASARRRRAAQSCAPNAAPAGRQAKAGNGASADAKRLAVALERGIADGQLDVATAEALQALIAAACRVYSARSEAGEQFPPVAQNSISRDRRHGDGERLVARRRSRGVRARHVAELDRTLNECDPLSLARLRERKGWNARRKTMDLIADRGRRVTIEELNTTRLLAHARKQAHQRKFDDMLIVDVDAHHYENENYDEFLPYMENDVLRQLTMSGRSKKPARIVPSQIGYQDMGGRVTRYPMRVDGEDRGTAQLRDVQLGHRWMDAMSVDYSCLFPTGMLNIGLHPQKEMEVELCWAYNRWLTEKVLPEAGRPLLLDAVPAVLRSRRGAAPRRDIRRPQACRRLHGDHRALEHGGARQRLHEGLSGDGGARPGAVVPLRPELGRADLQELQPLHLGACARLHLVQHAAPAPTGW